MKVLVLGSNGQVGQAMQEMSLKGAFPDCEFTWWTRKELDLMWDKEAIWEALESCTDFDVLLNLAAYTDVEKAEVDPLNKLINYTSVTVLADWCNTYSKKFVHISSDYVFDGSEGWKFVDSSCQPLNQYGWEKLASETYIQNHCDDFCVVRASSIYSEYGKNFAITMFNRFSKHLETSVVDTQWMRPTYAGNLCISIYVIIKNNVQGVQHYNDGDYMSWWDFAKKIAKRFDSYTLLKVSSFPSKVRRPKFSNLVVEDTLRDVEYHPQYKTIDEALTKIEETVQ